MTTSATITPDYGEPWTMREVFHECPYADRDELPLGDELEHRARIIACVNACAGMADPAAEISAMKGALMIAKEGLMNCQHAPWCDSRHSGWLRRCSCCKDLALAAINKALKEEQP